jgi:uncharacterized protein (TIGR02147 family)
MSIFEFDDYRPFLRQYIKNLPRQGRGEINRMAAHLGVHSSFISQVLAGSKDFNLEQTHELASFLALSALETDYLILLVELSRAGTHKLKGYFKSKLAVVKNQSLEISKRIPQDRILTDVERSIFYSSWLYLAVWLFSSVDKGQTLDSVAKRFDITRSRAGEILRFLVGAQLCKLKDDVYTIGPQLIHLEKGSPFLTKHHINWRVKAVQRSEDIEDQELMFTSPLSISKKDFEILREQMVNFIKSASDRVAKSPAEEIACLNLDLFWIKK